MVAAARISRALPRYKAVLSSFRKRLSYSNVTATAALFIALGGTSYAVMTVDSGDDGR